MSYSSIKRPSSCTHAAILVASWSRRDAELATIEAVSPWTMAFQVANTEGAIRSLQHNSALLLAPDNRSSMTSTLKLEMSLRRCARSLVLDLWYCSYTMSTSNGSLQPSGCVFVKHLDIICNRYRFLTRHSSEVDIDSIYCSSSSNSPMIVTPPRHKLRSKGFCDSANSFEILVSPHIIGFP